MTLLHWPLTFTLIDSWSWPHAIKPTLLVPCGNALGPQITGFIAQSLRQLPRQGQEVLRQVTWALELGLESFKAFSFRFHQPVFDGFCLPLGPYTTISRIHSGYAIIQILTLLAFPIALSLWICHGAIQLNTACEIWNLDICHGLIFYHFFALRYAEHASDVSPKPPPVLLFQISNAYNLSTEAQMFTRLQGFTTFYPSQILLQTCSCSKPRLICKKDLSNIFLPNFSTCLGFFSVKDTCDPLFLAENDRSWR